MVTKTDNDIIKVE